VSLRKFVAFFLGLAFFTTWPLLNSRYFFSGGNWVVSSIVSGCKNALSVSIFLWVCTVLRKKYKILSPGICLAAVYSLISIGLIILGLFGMKDEPLVWEGIGPLIIELCPISIFVVHIPFFNFIAGLILAVCFGALYYYFVGEVLFSRFLLKGERKE